MLGREVLDGRQLQPARLHALAHRPQVPFVPEALLVRHHLAGLVGKDHVRRPQLPGELHVPGREPGRGAGVTRERQRELGHRPRRPTTPPHPLSHLPVHFPPNGGPTDCVESEGGSVRRGAVEPKARPPQKQTQQTADGGSGGPVGAGTREAIAGAREMELERWSSRDRPKLRGSAAQRGSGDAEGVQQVEPEGYVRTAGSGAATVSLARTPLESTEHTWSGVVCDRRWIDLQRSEDSEDQLAAGGPAAQRSAAWRRCSPPWRWRRPCSPRP
eukprot:COSAG04_NODE_2221_length_4505_cov_4.174989_3_plen_272_part_00